MTASQIALFIHLLALLAATVASAIVKLAAGRRGAVQAQASLRRLVSAAHELPNDESPDRLAAVRSGSNTALAFAIAFVMTTKPGFAAAIGVLGIGAASGADHAHNSVRASNAVGDTSEFEAA
jgi:hypothetical protein